MNKTYNRGKRIKKENERIKETIEESNRRNLKRIIITKENIENVITRIPSWKAPVIDSIHGYYWKILESVRDRLVVVLMNG